eukprot:6455504-Amphidinium_carterae.4
MEVGGNSSGASAPVAQGPEAQSGGLEIAQIEAPSPESQQQLGPQPVPQTAPYRHQKLMDELSGHLGLVVLETIAQEHAALLDSLQAKNVKTK